MTTTDAPERAPDFQDIDSIIHRIKMASEIAEHLAGDRLGGVTTIPKHEGEWLLFLIIEINKLANAAEEACEAAIEAGFEKKRAAA